MQLKQKDKFIILIFCAVLLGVPTVDFVGKHFVRQNFFAFRAWEMMKTGVREGPFQSNAVFDQEIWGDLANILKVRKFRQYHSQRFTTDKYGFRNPQFPDGTFFPIVVIGDSDMVGSSLTDKETFARQLEKQMGLPVYNYADRNILHFIKDKRFLEHPPKLVLWEAVERTISSSNYKIYNRIPENLAFIVKLPKPRANIFQPKLSKYYAENIWPEIYWRLTKQLPSSIGYLDEDSGMLFYKEGLNRLPMTTTNEDIKNIGNGIKIISRILAKNKCNLIFMPLPDKENIYQQILPDKLATRQDDSFLDALHKELDSQNVLNIQLYGEYSEYGKRFARSRNINDLLYFRDDTHWNEKGISIAVRIVANFLDSKKLFK